ncbi:hypothetical protein [Microvirga sp. M2]|uniref:hypothetical protein n=1 Tax=Microvirga sp. M2 TaxID=3073270 RepID=UPI0039C06A64
MAETPKSRPFDEPGPDKKVRTLGEVLDELGFVPLAAPRHIVVQDVNRVRYGGSHHDVRDPQLLSLRKGDGPPPRQRPHAA